MTLLFRVLEGETQGGAFKVTPDKGFVIGRSADADYTLQDQSISRRHCRVVSRDGRYFLEDLGSQNGTAVNGKRIEKPREIREGDVIEIGESSLRVVGDRPLVVSEDEPASEEGAGPGKRICPACGTAFSGRACPACRKTDPAVREVIPGYHLEERIGEGAMGEIFKARQVFMDRLVAVKVLKFAAQPSEQSIGKFLREAKTEGRINHPNIVQVHDAGRAGDLHYIVMEYVDGVDLKRRLEKESRLSLSESLRIAVEVAKALQAAFREKVVHRDIKPGNILLSRTGAVKLADFGLSKSLDRAGLSGFTRHGTGMGTPNYIPPEQAQNAVYADFRADIYALAATTYHMVSGRPPFTGKSLGAVIKSVLNDEPPSLTSLRSECPPELETVLARALAKDPQDRFQNPSEFLASLQKITMAMM